MSYGNSYTFPALRGIQAGREYYVAMCPLKLLPKLFLFDESELPPELRAQRSINSSRVPEIARYILNNRQDYAFSAITACVDGAVQFEPAFDDPASIDIGNLVIPMSARFVINDGQHRRAAVEVALAEQPSLGDETIAVVFFVDAGLRRSQQLFADLNKHAVRPTKSIGILYDYRSPLATLARDLARDTPCFKGLTELEKTTLSNRSGKLFTLSGIYQATGALIGVRETDPISDRQRELAARFWTALGCVMPEWQRAIDRQVRCSVLRRDYVHAHGVVLHAIGLAGYTLLQEQPEKWEERLQRLRDLDWRRSATPLWGGRAMTGAQMSKAWQNIQLTAILIKKQLALPLSEAEEQCEERFQKARQEPAPRSYHDHDQPI